MEKRISFDVTKTLLHYLADGPGFIMNSFELITLSSERLTLRFLTEADIPTLFEMCSNEEVMRYWSSPPFTEIAQAQKMLADILDRYQTGQSLVLGIERRADNRFIGTCGLYHFHPTSLRAELGYMLDRPFWGFGYMQEALSAFIEYAFQTLGLNRLEADIDPRNQASAKTLERQGFQKEGYLRERWIVSGEVFDSEIYGLLRREWQANS